MGSALPMPIRVVEDLHILGNEQDKCKQELQTFEDEMMKLLLEMAEIEIKDEEFQNKGNFQEISEKIAVLVALQFTKANRFAALCQMKKENLEKQLKLLQMQYEQSVIFANIYEDIQKKMQEAQSDHQQRQEFGEDEKISLRTLTLVEEKEIGERQKIARKKLKESILGPLDNEEEEEEDDDEENPSEFMKLEKAALEKLKEKIESQNQSQAKSIWNKFLFKFK
ncbi:hypothetical protein M9Y10_016272 [Tritrichomonas musculus]|uniref:Uncharacterized protein n=1 Tax=Tritrichomonas musculus TaxID=1915356 RepID=A0ABR2HVT9_9EUKA